MQKSLGGILIIHLPSLLQNGKRHQKVIGEPLFSSALRLEVCDYDGWCRDECGMSGAWRLNGSDGVREEGSGVMLCFALRNLEAEGSVWTFLPHQDAPGVTEWMQAHMFSFWNQTELPFIFHGLGGNR